MDHSRVLDLSDNDVGDDGAKALVRVACCTFASGRSNDVERFGSFSQRVRFRSVSKTLLLRSKWTVFLKLMFYVLVVVVVDAFFDDNDDGDRRFDDDDDDRPFDISANDIDPEAEYETSSRSIFLSTCIYNELTQSYEFNVARTNTLIIVRIIFKCILNVFLLFIRGDSSSRTDWYNYG